jgi:hypothetical protein
MTASLEPDRDYYWENGLMVLTEAFLRQRGTCCGNGCRHCPYRETEPVPEDAPTEAPQAEPEGDCTPGADGLS